MPIVLCILAGGSCWYILFRAKYGMILRGIGNNPLAVERSGWSYLCAKMVNYALAGLMVICSGMAYTAVCMGADANSSATYCMMSIATVILGGCEDVYKRQPVSCRSEIFVRRTFFVQAFRMTDQ